MNGAGLTFRFEFFRTLRKPSFWIAALVLPVLAVLVGLLMTAAPPTTAGTNVKIPFSYTDASGQVNPDVARQLGGTAVGLSGEERARRASETRPYLAFPKQLEQDPVQVYAADRGPLDNLQYTNLAREVVRQSAAASSSDQALTAALLGQTAVVSHLTVDGAPPRPIGEILPPLMYAVALFAILLISGNRMLVSTLEEKENRVIEMILIGIRPLPMITGKILALFALTGVQIVVIAVPALGTLLLTGSELNALFGAVTITIALTPMLIGLLLLLGSLALFTGTLVAIGSLTNSAKDAGPYFACFLVMMTLPVYAISTLLADPSDQLVQLFLYFPFTAPITALVLNATGVLTAVQTVTVVTELLTLGAVAIIVAAQLFKNGALNAPSIRIRRTPRMTA
ncbi:ABC transporter permease [Curtobacterium flaccumfaciens]|uniref:ABC transporter permease n=1 Tax=Curtobacterium flaccumfaciens TaxID=2035 RepID=UPI00159EBFD6|nr:ABC transporter permease [Curtobacterium flaccumfaciens]